MTNCPNCGAPYALDSPVCEYCGTAREDEGGDKMRNLQRAQIDKEQAEYELALLRFEAQQRAQYSELMRAANSGVIHCEPSNRNAAFIVCVVTALTVAVILSVTLNGWNKDGLA